MAVSARSLQSMGWNEQRLLFHDNIALVLLPFFEFPLVRFDTG
jgi:hypothetical protein